MKKEVADDAASEGRILVTPQQRHEMVAVAAYLRAERRGFSPGHETEDWYEAAAAIDEMLANMRALGVTRGDYERAGLRNALRLWAPGARPSPP